VAGLLKAIRLNFASPSWAREVGAIVPAGTISARRLRAKSTRGRIDQVLRHRLVHRFPIGGREHVGGCATGNLYQKDVRRGEIEGELLPRMRPLEVRADLAQRVGQARGRRDHELRGPHLPDPAGRRGKKDPCDQSAHHGHVHP
jgi:hypothetical protein